MPQLCFHLTQKRTQCTLLEPWWVEPAAFLPKHVKRPGSSHHFITQTENIAHTENRLLKKRKDSRATLHFVCVQLSVCVGYWTAPCISFLSTQLIHIFIGLWGSAAPPQVPHFLHGNPLKWTFLALSLCLGCLWEEFFFAEMGSSHQLLYCGMNR